MATQVNPNASCDIYIANCTKQRWDFTYRLPGGKRHRMQPIEVGRQIKVSGQTTVADAQAIMMQWTKYGMRDVSEIEDARSFIGLVISRGKPLTREKFLHRIEDLNKAILTAKGEQMRLEAGIAATQQIEEATGAQLNELEISIVEDEHTDGSDPTFATNITISKNADPEKVSRQTRRVAPGQRRRAQAN